METNLKNMLRGRRIKIIIADDNEDFLEGVQILLATRDDTEVIAVYRDGAELLDSPKLYDADLIISDIQMPSLNGIDAASRINFRYHHIPMIALTMHMDKLYLNDIIGAGFKGFVYKPDAAIDLFPTIDAVLDNKFVFPKGIMVI
ncbi:MAG: response regulator transcription factor [Bacteroidales bacterium]|nr:response regulator transcription factor [Bacteroidales bacterium]